MITKVNYLKTNKLDIKQINKYRQISYVLSCSLFFKKYLYEHIRNDELL